MTIGLTLDREATARVCRSHGVSRLRIFGSAASERFDAERSDVDFLVDFAPASEDAFTAYFGLNEDLEGLLGRGVDLVIANAVENPYFAASSSRGAEVVYAA